jgi:hypothetical protein
VRRGSCETEIEAALSGRRQGPRGDDCSAAAFKGKDADRLGVTASRQDRQTRKLLREYRDLNVRALVISGGLLAQAAQTLDDPHATRVELTAVEDVILKLGLITDESD